ncbi:MAG: MerR family transcriptional regulator, partial [Luteibaculum sp.]
MNRLSIKEIEAYTGVKAHTIRIWEQRYNLVEPKRTDTNIRYYDSRDLKKLLNISFLNQHGFKISKLADLSDKEICELVRAKSKFKNGDSRTFSHKSHFRCTHAKFDYSSFTSGNGKHHDYF